MRRALALAIGLRAAAAAALAPRRSRRRRSRQPSVPFGAVPAGAAGPAAACCPARAGRRQSPPFMGLERDRGEAANLEPGQLPYDGRFMFARLRYTQGVRPTNSAAAGSARRGGRGQGPPWSHDYPRAERNFMKILDEITTIGPTRDRSAA